MGKLLVLDGLLDGFDFTGGGLRDGGGGTFGRVICRVISGGFSCCGYSIFGYCCYLSDLLISIECYYRALLSS
jgi:hypothetical protein